MFIICLLYTSQADFVTMAEQKAFEGRIAYNAEDIVAMIERAVQIMFARYAYMRKMREENGEKDLKKFFEYGLEPYFLVCDEYNALCGKFSNVWRTFVQINQRYTEVKQIAEAYSLQEVYDKLK